MDNEIPEDEEPMPVLRLPLPTETLVMEGGTQLMRFDGLLPLPTRSRINIDNGIPGAPDVPLDRGRFPTGRADAIVSENNIWGTQGGGRILALRVVLSEPGDGGDFAFLA